MKTPEIPGRPDKESVYNAVEAFMRLGPEKGIQDYGIGGESFDSENPSDFVVLYRYNMGLGEQDNVLAFSAKKNKESAIFDNVLKIDVPASDAELKLPKMNDVRKDARVYISQSRMIYAVMILTDNPRKSILYTLAEISPEDTVKTMQKVVRRNISTISEN